MTDTTVTRATRREEAAAPKKKKRRSDRARAEARLGSEHRDLRRLIAEVERVRQELAETRDSLEVERADAEKLRRRLADERAALEEERRNTAKKMRTELEDFRRQTAERLRRAGQSLESGQVEVALLEVLRLPGHERADPWIANARRYVAAHRALDRLESAALLEPRAPMTRSPSQCPGTARSVASAGRAVIVASPTQDFPRGRAASFEAGTREVRPLRRAFSRASSARRLPRPCT